MNTEKANRFFNRELSWLEFNGRVLGEARRADVPLLERLRFLSIVTSNFNEFFMVRVAALKRQAVAYASPANPERRDIAGFTVREQLSRVAARVNELLAAQYDCYTNELLPALAGEGIVYIGPANYEGRYKRYLEALFEDEVYPLLTPMKITEEGLFPHITNLKLYAGFLLRQEFGTLPFFSEDPAKQPLLGEGPLAIVQIPASINRVIWLPDMEQEDSGVPGQGKTKCFALLDDVVAAFGERLFPGYSVQETLLFKVTRDADFSVDENRDDDFIEAMEEVLENRRLSMPVKLVCNSGSAIIQETLTARLGLSAEDVCRIDGTIDLGTLSDIANIEGYSHLKHPPWKHIRPPELPRETPLWDEIKRTDVMLHLPYQSYEPVLHFINEAADDHSVLAIKMTLYRTSGDSPLVHALERAARNGKQVTAFVELKARFDEKQNISWAERLEKAGVIVVYGIARLKVHAKMLLVVRREPEGIRRYVHLSTGNYNDKTAKLYSDISLFTSNQDIAKDATLFFNMISGYSAIQPMKRLFMAPINLKSQLLEMIERETLRSTRDTPGLIMAKMNSLADPDIIEALYRASSAFVRVMLNVRGICMLVPGVPGQSENITVVSIIGRYLEHSRIFYFQNGGAEEIYLSSADWMPRNLERRVELMFPVLQENIRQKILKILHLYFSDNTRSHYLQSSGQWRACFPEGDEPPVHAQQILYEWEKEAADSLSGETPREFVVRRNFVPPGTAFPNEE